MRRSMRREKRERELIEDSGGLESLRETLIEIFNALAFLKTSCVEVKSEKYRCAESCSYHYKSILEKKPSHREKDKNGTRELGVQFRDRK